MSNEEFIEESRRMFKSMNKEDKFRLFHPEEKTSLKVDVKNRIVEVIE